MGGNVQTEAISAPRKIFVYLLLCFFILPELDVPVIGDLVRKAVNSTGIALPWGMALTVLFFLTSHRARAQLAQIPTWLLTAFAIFALYLLLQALFYVRALDATALRAVVATLTAPVIVVGTFIIASNLPWRFVPLAMAIILVLSFGVFLNQFLGLGLNNFIIENWTEVWFYKVQLGYKSLGPSLAPREEYTPTIGSEASHEVYTYLSLLIMGYVAMRRRAISGFAWLFVAAVFLFVMINNGSRSSLFIVVIAGVIFYLLNLLASYKQNVLKTIFYILIPVVGALHILQIPAVFDMVAQLNIQWRFLEYWAETHYEGRINADAMQLVFGPRFYPLAVHIQTPLYYPVGLPINTSIEEIYQFSQQKLNMDPIETTNVLLTYGVENRELINQTASEKIVESELVTSGQIYHTLHSNLSPRTWITYTWAYLGILGWLITVSLYAYSAFVAYLLFKRNELILAAVLLTIVIASSVSTGVGGTQLYFIFGLLCAIAHGHLNLPPRSLSEEFLNRGRVIR